jgi:hypothetical protein
MQRGPAFLDVIEQLAESIEDFADIFTGQPSADLIERAHQDDDGFGGAEVVAELVGELHAGPSEHCGFLVSFVGHGRGSDVHGFRTAQAAA